MGGDSPRVPRNQDPVVTVGTSFHGTRSASTTILQTGGSRVVSPTGGAWGMTEGSGT